MNRVEIRDLSEPEAVVNYPLGATYQVRLAGTVVSHHVLRPGWSWEEHAQPQVGTPSCELYHRGVVLSGRMGVRTDEGEEVVIGPNQVFDLPPGHLTWVEGGVRHRVWVTAEGRPARLLLERAAGDGDRLGADFEWSNGGGIAAVRIEAPAKGSELTVRYLSIEYRDNPPEAFRLTLPSDIPIQRLD